MPALLTDFNENPTGSLVTIRCAPWHYRDRIALVGDAAHAVVPFYGQGMNAAFEDCVALDQCLAEFSDDRRRAFAEYYHRRKANSDALADLALHNFIEMRDKTASRIFRAKKKLDHALEGLLPGIYLPLYFMVSFTRIPYAAASRRAGRQDRIVYGILIGVMLLIAFSLGIVIWWSSGG
jgi:kynurenine 3-monooxygenase